MIITKTGAVHKYKCSKCGIDYTEQRNIEEPQFFTNCQATGCDGIYELTDTEEFTYEQEIPDPIPAVEEPTE